jgi:hypothetical protein
MVDARRNNVVRRQAVAEMALAGRQRLRVEREGLSTEHEANGTGKW